MLFLFDGEDLNMIVKMGFFSLRKTYARILRGDIQEMFGKYTEKIPIIFFPTTRDDYHRHLSVFLIPIV